MRNYLLDIIKLFLALFVVLGHTYILVIRNSPDQMLSLQNIAVDGFFIISGFFLARSTNKIQKEYRDDWTLFLKFNLHRYIRLFPEFFVSLILSALVYYFAFDIKLFNLILVNLIFISQINTVNGVLNGSWFVSVLYYAGALLSVILLFSKDSIKYSLIFILTLFSFFFIYSYYGNLSLNQYPLIADWLSIGWIKGLMDLGIGILTFSIVEISNKSQIKLQTRTALIMALIALSFVLYSGIHFGLGRRDFLCLPGYAVLIYLCSIDQTQLVLKQISTQRWGGVLESLSYLSIPTYAWFLSHCLVINLLLKFTNIKHLPSLVQIVLVIITSWILAIILYKLSKLIRKLNISTILFK